MKKFIESQSSNLKAFRTFFEFEGYQLKWPENMVFFISALALLIFFGPTIFRLIHRLMLPDFSWLILVIKRKQLHSNNLDDEIT